MGYGGQYCLPPGSNSLFEIVNNNSSAASLNTLDIENNFSSLPINIQYLFPEVEGYWCIGEIHSITADKMVFKSLCQADNGELSKIYNHKTEAIELVDSLGSIALSPSGNYAFNPVTNDLLKFDIDQWIPFTQINLEISWYNKRIWINKDGKEQIYFFKDKIIQVYEWDENLQPSTPITMAASHNLPKIIYNPYFDISSGFIAGDFIKNEFYKEHIIIRREDMEILIRVELEKDVIAKIIKNTMYLSNGRLIDKLL
jgi:hypothetical protein